MSKLVIPSGAVDQSVTIPANNPELVISIADANLVSDGYHSFGELYQHRCLLFIALCNQLKETGWKAWKNHEGGLIEGWFLAGITLPTGDISYHLPAEMWTLLKLPQWDRAPRFDGHTSHDVVDRLTQWLTCDPKPQKQTGRFSKTIEAVQFAGFESPNHVGQMLARFLEDVVISASHDDLVIHTQNSILRVAIGDWIIRDKDTLSCCKPDQFAAIYQSIE